MTNEFDFDNLDNIYESQQNREKEEKFVPRHMNVTGG